VLNDRPANIFVFLCHYQLNGWESANVLGWKSPYDTKENDVWGTLRFPPAKVNKVVWTITQAEAGWTVRG